jgi:hypothetical protein
MLITWLNQGYKLLQLNNLWHITYTNNILISSDMTGFDVSQFYDCDAKPARRYIFQFTSTLGVAPYIDRA